MCVWGGEGGCLICSKLCWTITQLEFVPLNYKSEFETHFNYLIFFTKYHQFLRILTNLHHHFSISDRFWRIFGTCCDKFIEFCKSLQFSRNFGQKTFGVKRKNGNIKSKKRGKLKIDNFKRVTLIYHIYMYYYYKATATLFLFLCTYKL